MQWEDQVILIADWLISINNSLLWLVNIWYYSYLIGWCLIILFSDWLISSNTLLWLVDVSLYSYLIVWCLIILFSDWLISSNTVLWLVDIYISSNININLWLVGQVRWGVEGRRRTGAGQPRPRQWTVSAPAPTLAPAPRMMTRLREKWSRRTAPAAPTSASGRLLRVVMVAEKSRWDCLLYFS